MSAVGFGSVLDIVCERHVLDFRRRMRANGRDPWRAESHRCIDKKSRKVLEVIKRLKQRWWDRLTCCIHNSVVFSNCAALVAVGYAVMFYVPFSSITWQMNKSLNLESTFNNRQKVALLIE